MKRDVPFARRLRSLLGCRPNVWLATMSGISTPMISRIMNGDRSPTNASITALAAAFDVSVEDLVRGTDASDKAADPFVPREQFERVTQNLHAALEDVAKWKAECARLTHDHHEANRELRASLVEIARSL